MAQLEFTKGKYRTPQDARSLLSRISPSAAFYSKFLGIVLRASSEAKQGRYGNREWAETSCEVMSALEAAGVYFEISGVDYFRSLEGPCVFIGNHMSTLETMILPGIIQPIKDVTFVVKQGLLDYPVFRHIMRSRDPIAVGRSNPREDLVAVMEGGVGRLGAGRSIIIFPQTTRTPEFDPAQFNTIGVKLAKRAGVPVVPIALRTDAWANGTVIKEVGKIDPAKKVYFQFGEPLRVQSRGAEEHEAVVSFIQKMLAFWQSPSPV